MEGSSSGPTPTDPQLPSTPTIFQVPQSAARRIHYRSAMQDFSHSGSSAPPTFPNPCPPNYHLYRNPAPHITTPHVPGLDPVVGPPPLQPGIAVSQSSAVPGWQPDNLVRNCPICDTLFTFLFRRHHCRLVRLLPQIQGHANQVLVNAGEWFVRSVPPTG